MYKHPKKRSKKFILFSLQKSFQRTKIIEYFLTHFTNVRTLHVAKLCRQHYKNGTLKKCLDGVLIWTDWEGGGIKIF